MASNQVVTIPGGKIDTCVPDDHDRRRPSLLGRCLFRLARRAQHRSAVHTATDLQRTTNEIHYRSWRRNELEQQLVQNFDVRELAGRDVLDFGCGTGELCELLATHNPNSLVGVDKSSDAVSRASESIAQPGVAEACAPEFLCNERHERLPLDDQSVDLICCFDVVEHIPDMQAIANEWRRVLRPGGRVWIWWSPWRGPHGHHLESLIPLPWVHLLLPERVIFETCAALYDDPDYVPRKWDLDPVTHEKKPNKWRDTSAFFPFLNRLTRRQFEKIVRRAGLAIHRKETHGFSGSRLRRATRVLLPFPIVGDCFVSFYLYELELRE